MGDAGGTAGDSASASLAACAWAMLAALRASIRLLYALPLKPDGRLSHEGGGFFGVRWTEDEAEAEDIMERREEE